MDFYTHTYTTIAEAIEALIVTPLMDSGEDTAFFDIEAIADQIIESSTTDNGKYLFRTTVDTDSFWEIVMAHAYEIITYTAGTASTTSDHPEAKAYVEAFNAGAGADYLEQVGARAVPIDTHDGYATYERFIPANNLTHAHAQVLQAEEALTKARAARDKLICALEASGQSMYSISKDLAGVFGDKGMSQQAVQQIVRKGRASE